MGNCLIWDKGNSVSPEEKLFKEMLDEMRERRVNNLYYYTFLDEVDTRGIAEQAEEEVKGLKNEQVL